ncbi:MAG: hypothetical protein AAF492_30595, partial [Verrucomicrobiota bacterium]
EEMLEQERMQVDLIDGKLLAELVLEDIPEVLMNMSMHTQYRVAVAETANVIKEAPAYGCHHELRLDDIYVDVEVGQQSAILEKIANHRVNRMGTMILSSPKKNIVKLMAACWKWGEGPVLHNPPQDELLAGDEELRRRYSAIRSRINSRIRRRKDDISGLNRELRQQEKLNKEKGRKLSDLIDDTKVKLKKKRTELKELEELQVIELNLDGVLVEIQNQVVAYFKTFAELDLKTITDEELFEILEEGKRISRNIDVFVDTELFGEHWVSIVIDQPHREDEHSYRASLPAEMILKIGGGVFIQGGPGSGKTTLMRHMTRSVARDASDTLPILIYLVKAKCQSVASFKKEFRSELKNLGYEVSSADFEDML